MDLFQCVENFLDRLRIYTEIPLSTPMSNIIVNIMAEVLSVLSLATKQIKEGRLSKWFHTLYKVVIESESEKYAKKLFGESEIEDILQRLDRLTVDEARMTGTETLQVIHCLMTNMKLVMAGMQPIIVSLSMAHCGVVGVDGRTSTDGIRTALGMFVVL